jgi:hypothetical protein
MSDAKFSVCTVFDHPRSSRLASFIADAGGANLRQL